MSCVFCVGAGAILLTNDLYQILHYFKFCFMLISFLIVTVVTAVITIMIRLLMSEKVINLSTNIDIDNCQALSIYLNLSLSLRDRDRADTIITFHHHRKLFKHLEVTYSQV